jgi:biotin synthase-like enzyme
MGKYDPVFTCVCCGMKLPGTRQELIQRGCATITNTGQTYFHCPTHSAEDVQKMIRAVPVFETASEYRKNPI